MYRNSEADIGAAPREHPPVTASLDQIETRLSQAGKALGFICDRFHGRGQTKGDQAEAPRPAGAFSSLERIFGLIKTLENHVGMLDRHV